jgi:hypothetical protein
LVMAVMTSLALDTGEHHGQDPCRCRETCLADVLHQDTVSPTM